MLIVTFTHGEGGGLSSSPFSKLMKNKQGIHIYEACQSCIFHAYNTKLECYCSASGAPVDRNSKCHNWQPMQHLLLAGHQSVLSQRKPRPREYMLWHLDLYNEYKELASDKSNPARCKELKRIFDGNAFEFWKKNIK